MSRDPIIPGAKLIEQGLAALPSQARLEVENRELRAEIAVLKKENAELKTQVAALQPPTDVSVDAVKLLQILFRAQNPMMDFEIVSASGMEKGFVIHHLRSLQKLNFALWHLDAFGITRWSISHEGSSFLLKHTGQ